MSTTENIGGGLVPFAARIEAAGPVPCVLERGGWLTGYIEETLADDALHAGVGARVELRVPDRAISAVEARFRWLRQRGIALSVLGADGGSVTP